MTKKILSGAFLLLLAFAFTACEKDDPIIPNEEELITTVIYGLAPADGSASVILTFQDTDGDGGMEPVITNGTLMANMTYAGTLQLLDESQSTPEDITTEIQAEDEDHQFFFASDIDGLAVTYGDTDSDGKPVGLSTTLTTGEAGAGTLSITLRHEPKKSADGVSDGDITNAQGETDIQVTFNVDVQ